MMALAWLVVLWALTMATIHYFRKTKNSDKNPKTKQERQA